MTSRTKTTVALVAVAALSAVVFYLVMTLPTEALLGSKVKLPIFHGASTWVALGTFTVMGILALLYAVLRKPALYAWEAGLRWVSIGLWVVNTALGLYAALNTWDFTGSKSSPLQVAMQDPRLTAQFWLLIGTGVLIIVILLLDRDLWRAFADMAFVVAMWALLLPVFIDPNKRALHPDNPVLNSDWTIKLPFFSIVAGIAAIAVILSWLVAQRVRARHATEANGESSAQG